MHVPFSASKIGLILSCLAFPSSELEAVFSFKRLFDSGILKKPLDTEIIDMAYKSRR